MAALTTQTIATGFTWAGTTTSELLQSYLRATLGLGSDFGAHDAYHRDGLDVSGHHAVDDEQTCARDDGLTA